jgi:pilus assembly protein CpaB
VNLDDLRTPRRPQRSGPRRIGSRAFLFWLLALGAGGLAALLLHGYVQSRVSANVATTSKVAVAAETLDLATPLSEHNIRMTDWPDSVPALDAIRNPKQLFGRVVVTKVVKGQMLLESMLAPKESGTGLAALIPPSMRAVAVRVDDVVGVAGFIHPEDRVDVIVTIRPDNNAETMSKVILQNVEVLTVGQEMEAKDGVRNKPLSVTVATLLVTPSGSEKLALAANQGKLLLSLRGRSDVNEASTAGVVPTALLGGHPEPARGPAPADRPPATLPRKHAPSVALATPNKAELPPQRQTVEILRGDRFEQRRFDVRGTP